ncbi:hypothetical protein SAMN04488020_103142 [Palleronia marisminoris]|uniref:Heat induced stress protein YflT n=1 Tax=Palleronia marisminoris TaxID=315423 RepID=A0A1Y5S981_9RHOB|nr:hypothetical protein [Palleronia marisminoris]SFG66913.1 hypothetical protein SAMN04488020_103142 [Palleronia marisminoris]SLN34231.1 hypothetical protein PAM7066_01422 [Palleronia marisminoris]
MHRNITAIYRTHAVADLVRRELSELGISSSDIRVVPDRDEPVDADGHRTDNKYSDQLHDLHLPDEDLRTYQQSVRRGDYVVSAEVDENQVGRAKEIMRRPEGETHNLDQRSGEFEGETVDPYSDPDNRRTNADWAAERDHDHSDPYTRSYKRNTRLNENN